jgi:Potential Queuosine, Q, salvage protein family
MSLRTGVGPARQVNSMNPLLPSLYPIWNNPRVVFLNLDRVRTLAEEFASQTLVVPSWREPVFPKDDSDTFVDFIGVGNAINFAFTAFDTYESFSVEYADSKWRGAFAMWACLARALERRPDMLRGAYLAQLSLSDVEEIFTGTVPIPLVEDRWKLLNEVGAILESTYDGYFHNLFSRANFSAFGGDGVVDRLLEHFPSFRDESVHRETGAILRFAKRAQLLAMMYQGRAMSSAKLARLSDGHDLGPIADYSVPRSLRSLGILRYAPELEVKVRSRGVIEKGSLEEQEIRAQTVHAQVALLKEMQERHNSRVSALNLDYKLWMLGRKATEPHHLTITTAY